MASLGTAVIIYKCNNIHKGGWSIRASKILVNTTMRPQPVAIELASFPIELAYDLGSQAPKIHPFAPSFLWP